MQKKITEMLQFVINKINKKMFIKVTLGFVCIAIVVVSCFAFKKADVEPMNTGSELTENIVANYGDFSEERVSEDFGSSDVADVESESSLVSDTEESEAATFSYETVTEKIPYNTTTKYDSSLVEGVNKSSGGEYGKQEVTYCYKMIGDEIVETTTVETKVISKPVDKVVTKGTKPLISKNWISELTPPSNLSLDASGFPTSYKECIIGEATAYYGDTNTATGVKPKPGYVAVDPKKIPYGTEMYIVSKDGNYVYGYAIAADTGGFIHNGKTIVDLFFNTRTECYNFGRRDVVIYILN